MKVLVVAHPDDEAIWFTPEAFDRIIIVFGDFGDGRSGDGRRAAIAAHPLKDRIIHLNLKESNYWRDKSKAKEYLESELALTEYLKTLKPDEVVTHNAMGEYQHMDHIMVHRACMLTFDCPVNGKDPKLYREIRKTYADNGAWTWY